jgi:hypothetical protein
VARLVLVGVLLILVLPATAAAARIQQRQAVFDRQSEIAATTCPGCVHPKVTSTGDWRGPQRHARFPWDTIAAVVVVVLATRFVVVRRFVRA